MQNVIKKVGIIGAGQLGSALGQALSRAHVEVGYFDKDESKANSSLSTALEGAQVILICTPSWEVKDVIKHISRNVEDSKGKLIVTAAKGVEDGFVTMDKLLSEKLRGEFDYGVIYGPMIAEEIARERMASGVLGLSNDAWVDPLREVFALADIMLEYEEDMYAVSLCGVLKNVYAMAFGMVAGMHLGLNAKGRLGVLTLNEMKQLLHDMGSNPRVAEGTAGLGDLLATGFNENSFNFRVGKSVAEGIAGEHLRSEGLVTLQELSEKIDIKKYPILHALSNAVFHYGNPHELQKVIES